MTNPRFNPATVCPNPSRRRDESGGDHGVGPCQNGKSVRNVSNAAVTDLGSPNPIYIKKISLSPYIYVTQSRPHAREPALRPRTREGLCDVFQRRIGSAPTSRCDPIAPRSHTFAPCCVPLPRLAIHRNVACGSTRANEWDSPGLPPGRRYYRKLASPDWPAGTGPRIDTLSFACPTFLNA